MNLHTRKHLQYVLATALCLLAAGLWLAAPALAGGPETAQTPAVAPAAPAAPAAAPAPPAPAWPGEGESHTSYLGIDVRDVTPDSAKQLKLREERGAEITMVDQDAPAGKAGFREHDVILDFDGQKVESVEQLRRMIHEVPPGRSVTIGYSRDGQVRSVQVQLADRTTMEAQSYTFAMPKVAVPNVEVRVPRIEMPAIQIVTLAGSRAGLLVSNVTPQLGEYFGCKNGECVLVQSVEKGSVAEAAGFKAGDVILKVDNQRVADMSDWRSVLREHRGGGKVAVTILRERREQTLSLTLPAGRESGDAFRFQWPGMNLDMQAMERSLAEAQRSMECAQGQAQEQAAVDQVELRRALERAQQENAKAMKGRSKEIERQMKEMQKQMEKQMEKLREMNLVLEED
ncbi:MAG TPA: PDZ domain-containing protein [Terriglobales bacterium]|nr:PDZ domain-containing protein [Terriglobales bacterium]